MLISRFNRFFARHGRVAFLTIGVVVIVTFVFYMTPGRGGGGASSGRTGPEVGEMYGRPLEREAFFEKLRATEIAIFLQWGQLVGQDDRMFGFLVNETLKRIRLVREAKARGLDRIGDDEVIGNIQDCQALKTEGRFDRKMFDMFKQNILARRGIDGRAFDGIVRESIMIARLEAEVVADVYVSPEQVREAFNRERETFSIRYRDYALFDHMSAPELQPPRAEIEAYFEAHKSELRLPDSRRVRVARFLAEQFVGKVELKEAEVRGYFDRNKARMYEPKKKTYEDVKGEIEERLRRSKARSLAGDAARELDKKLREALEKAPDAVSTELFQTACKAAGVSTEDSGPFTEEPGEIPGIGKVPRLKEKVLALGPEAPFSAVVYDAGNYYLACWLETRKGKPADSLTPSVEKQIVAALKKAAAAVFYAEHVETYREPLSRLGGMSKLKPAYAEEVLALTDKTDEEKAALIETYNKTLNDYLKPYFVPEQRKVRVVAFSPSTYAPLVTVTSEDVQAHYDAHPETYQREEVRVRHILVRVAPTADETAKDAKRQQIDGIRAELASGRDFAAVAKQKSEDAASKRRGGDLGFFARDEREPAFSEAAFALEPGQISAVVETRQGLHLVKLDGRRQGRPLAEVAAEIRKQLSEQGADHLAEDAALSLADAAFTALADAAEGQSAAELFAALADREKYLRKDSDWFRERGSIPPFGFQSNLVKAGHKLNADQPLSDAVKGTDAYYVACWLDSKDAYLPAFGEDGAAADSVVRHVKRDASRALARQKAAAVFAELQAKLAAGTAFETAIEGVPFEVAKEFTRKRPPSGMNGGQEVAEVVTAAVAATLLEPVQTDAGAILVYIVSRVLPTDEEFEAERDSTASRMKREKERDTLLAFYQRLEEESNTTLSDAFKPKT